MRERQANKNDHVTLNLYLSLTLNLYLPVTLSLPPSS